MKLRIGSAFITALLLSLSTAFPAFAQIATLQASPGSRINVRDRPSTSATARHYGLPGDRVTILESTNAPDGFLWYLVQFPNSGARGWVRSDLVRVQATSTERVSFAPGTAAATVGGRVQGNQTRDYLLTARGGQTMSTRITGTSPYLQMQVFAPDGTILYTGSRNWSGRLPRSGDYRVRVRLVPEEQRSGNSGEYSLNISIR